MSESKTLKQLRKKLHRLQQDGAVVLADQRRVRHNLYTHLAELYLWWRDAKMQDGYLDAEYATLDRPFKEKVIYGINFGPLIWLAWGLNNIKSSQDADRYSRTINAVHEEYEKRPDFYKKDGVAKLCNFIKQSGGVTRLAGYAPPQKEPEEDVSELLDSEEVAKPITPQERQIALLKLSSTLEEYGLQNPVDCRSFLKSNESDYGLLLFRKTASGFNLLESFDDSASINAALSNHIRRRFEVAVFAIRPLLELLQTQALPKQLEKLVERLIDVTKLPEEGGRKFISDRRVLYRPGLNQFILSPVNSLSGVVSIAQPFFPLILDDCEKDVFLAAQERELLESSILRDFEFNLYNVQYQSHSIPHYSGANSASNVVHLRHREEPNTFLNLSFWPFYSTLEGPQDQLSINPDFVLRPIWKSHLDRDAFIRLENQCLEPWLRGHATHLTREKNALMKVTFAEDKWTMEFVFSDGDFENSDHVEISYLDVTAGEVTALFLAKDWVPAMRSLALLPITASETKDLMNEEEGLESDVLDYGLSLRQFVPEEALGYKGAITLTLAEEVLKIDFCTAVFGGSQHTIYVPTASIDGKRATAPFIRYFPEITEDLRTPEEIAEELHERPPSEWPAQTEEGLQ